MNSILKMAVLVDGDNAQPRLLKAIINEVAKYGKITIRRIYGDWTSQHMNGWKEVVNETSFIPMQKFSYTTGKNSTDSALIIDAMDILYSKTVEGICIVSSDSDYTGLAKRIREDGLFVMGIGERKTPNAFVSSCEIFTHIENIIDNYHGIGDAGSLPKDVMILLQKAYEMAAADNNQAYVAKVGVMLHNLDSSFDTRDYGFSNLSTLLRSLTSTYEVIENMKEGLNHPLIRQLKPV